MSLGPYQFAGGVAVLTGAASGIGEQLAYGLAERGSSLVLLDRDRDRLEDVHGAIRRNHPRLAVSTKVVDLADRSAVRRAAERIVADQPRIGLLINNAGVALAGRFEQLSLAEFEWVMDVNFRATVALTHHLLPALIASPGSHLVNISSLFGLIGPAGQSAYTSSKFAVRGFTEVLRAELAPRRIGVTTVHPGGVRTRIAQNARIAAQVDARDSAAGRISFERWLTFPPEKAAAQILEGVRKRRPRVVITPTAVALDLLARLLPTSYQRVLRSL